MRSGDLLRQLDQRLLPHLVGAVNRLARSPVRPGVLPTAMLLSCLAVLFTAVWASGGTPAGNRGVDEVTRVGVAAGESIPGYMQDATADLAALPAAASPPSGDGTFALVSLSTYLTPQRAAVVLDDVPVAAVIGRVPMPERQTEVVRITTPGLPDDVVAAMTDLAARKDREAGDYRARAATVSPGRPEQRELYLSAAHMAAAEATAYRGGCACVYAAVVRAEPVALRRVASQPDVRVVDPAPEVRRLDRTVFTPPLPEQDAVAQPLANTDMTTPDPVTPDPGSPDPVTSASVVPDPVPFASVVPDSLVPDAVTSAPVVPDPVTPGPVTPAPSGTPSVGPGPEARKSPLISLSPASSYAPSPTPMTSANAIGGG